MHAYLQMTFTVLLSLLGSTMLKLSHGFTNLPPTLVFLVSYCLAYYCFARALRTIPLSVGYAICPASAPPPTGWWAISIFTNR